MASLSVSLMTRTCFSGRYELAGRIINSSKCDGVQLNASSMHLLPSPRNSSSLQVMLVGPSDTMYEGGFFKVRNMFNSTSDYTNEIHKGIIWVER